jgi:pyridoxine 5-phosphate synthase
VVCCFKKVVSMRTKLSVNINKIAVIRNSRGGNMPNVVNAAVAIERFGGQGITVHPRPDARHIRYSDVVELKEVVTTELNIEGNPIESFVDLVCKVVPAQVTLVPDAEDAITSNAGWDTVKNRAFLTQMCDKFHQYGIRVSIFVDPDPEMVRGAKECGADRVELYTEAYASGYAADREAAIAPYVVAAQAARECGLGLNAGHDLSLENLEYFAQCIPWCDEVSIGHALISDALYFGLENTVQLYRRCLKDE